MIAEQTRSESEQSERMDFGNYLQQSIQILQLDTDAIREVSKDEDALLPALIFFAVSGLAIGAGRYSFETLIFGPILVTLLSFVFVGLLSILSRLFGGSASFLALYRPIGLAVPVQWVQAVPIIGPFLGFFALVYLAVIAGLTLECVGALSRPRAVAVIALLASISLFLFLVFFAMIGSLMLFRAFFS